MGLIKYVEAGIIGAVKGLEILGALKLADRVASETGNPVIGAAAGGTAFAVVDELSMTAIAAVEDALASKTQQEPADSTSEDSEDKETESEDGEDEEEVNENDQLH